ncbi:hypothetical protein E3N88_30408 [Mikania micrantha]|uniref:BED-type domain-containing protein n=1 Tax=Mikania micrantha TaxID=192012 RepID=A0A5N6MPI4_9ASTR|nr:hypothetical protein E3N88_30408 [Mikania micrantha]
MEDMTGVAYLSQNVILQSRHAARVDAVWQALHLMSDDSCSGPFLSNEDQYLDIRSPFESSEFQSSADTPTMENNPNVVIIDGEANEAARDTTAGVEQANAANCEEQDPFTKKKRKKTSVTWEHFREITLDNGTQMHECIHCGEKVKKFKDGTTTPMRRHINQFCPKLQHVKKGQLKLNVFPGNSESSSMFVRDSLDELFKEYVESHKESNIDSSKSATVESGPSGSGGGSGSGSGSGASFMASRFGKDIKTGRWHLNDELEIFGVMVRVSSYEEFQVKDIILE